MAYDYFGSTVYHAIIRLLNDGEMVTHETLYRLCLERVVDRTSWLVEALHGIGASLASTAQGTRATVLGTRNLTTFSLYDAETNPSGELGPGGLLDGKSLLVDEDTAPGEQIVFSAPMTAADIVMQVQKGAPTNKAASLDASGRLVLASMTIGAASSLAVSGSAAALLGLPQGTATGKDGADDGASKVGFAGYGAFPAGTVRSALVNLLESTSNLLATKAARSGDTFTGPVTFNDVATFLGPVNDMKYGFLPDADTTIQPSDANLLLFQATKAQRTYMIAEPGTGPRRVRFVRPNSSPYNATIRRASDNATLVSLTSNAVAWVDIWHVDGAWRVVAWGGGGITHVAW
jgi:hypothetical protein